VLGLSEHLFPAFPSDHVFARVLPRVTRYPLVREWQYMTMDKLGLEWYHKDDMHLIAFSSRRIGADIYKHGS